MQFEPDQWYHVYNRGNNSQRLFFSRENYIFFLEKMRKQILPLADVIAYCLMPNHFHWMLHVNPPPSDGCFRRLTGTPGKQYPLPPGRIKITSPFLPVRPQTQRSDGEGSNQTGHPLVGKIAVLLSSYAQAINRQEGRSGSLFQSRTKAKRLASRDRDYPLTCFHYIHQNPLAAGLVQQLDEWEFSSYKDYAGLRSGTLPDKDFTFKWLGIKDEKAFIQASHQSLDPDKLKKCF